MVPIAHNSPGFKLPKSNVAAAFTSRSLITSPASMEIPMAASSLDSGFLTQYLVRAGGPIALAGAFKDIRVAFLTT